MICVKVQLFSPGCGLWVLNKAHGSQGESACGFGFPRLGYLLVRRERLAVEVPDSALSPQSCVDYFLCLRLLLPEPFLPKHEASASGSVSTLVSLCSTVL